jgi:pyrimidine deaminase RibD-like protein
MQPSGEIAMTNTHRTMMHKAIGLAEECEPIEDRIPEVGAVIAIGDTVVGRGHRGTGKPKDGDHAEMMAFRDVVDKTQLPRATLYTTLEPCTRDVRTDPSKCCTELIKLYSIKKVFIGILDPNQGVRGKGLWEVQSNKIEVELFPHDLAERIRALNTEFIRVQQTLGIQITSLEPGQRVRTYDKRGELEVQGTFLNPPGADVFAFVGSGGQWWPQPHSLRVTGDRTWAVKIYFGDYGPRTVCIVKASELGTELVGYYRKICAMNIERERVARDYFREAKTDGTEILGMLAYKHPGIEMGLHKGIEIQAMVEIVVEAPPATRIEIKQIS